MKRYLLAASVCATMLFACNDAPKEDIVNDVPKDGSIETSVKVDHLNDSTDILITTHKVYKDALSAKTFETKDTIPALGNIKIPDENGNDKMVKKDYNIFITVK